MPFKFKYNGKWVSEISAKNNLLSIVCCEAESDGKVFSHNEVQKIRAQFKESKYFDKLVAVNVDTVLIRSGRLFVREINDKECTLTGDQSRALRIDRKAAAAACDILDELQMPHELINA